MRKYKTECLCPKCGHGGEYYPASVSLISDYVIQRCCQNCKHIWDEATLDHPMFEKNTVKKWGFPIPSFMKGAN